MENDGEKCWHLLRSDHARSLPNVTAPPYPFLLKRFPLLASASHVAAEGPFSAMTRCSGKTRAGNRCSITSASTMKDDRGRLVAQPLRCGGEFCALHAKPFCVRPAQLDESRAVLLVFLDLETTGVDVACDRIVELAATHAPADHRAAGSNYSTVVRVDPAILRERGGEAAVVHGISNEEIALGPCFLEAWARFLEWIESLLNSTVLEIAQDTDDDEPRSPRLPEEPPILLLAAHNGVRALVRDGERQTTSSADAHRMLIDRVSIERCASTFRFYFAKCFATGSHARAWSNGCL